MADPLTSAEQIAARQWLAREMRNAAQPIDYNKPIAHAAVQAVIDLLESAGTQTAVNSAINGATQPTITLSAGQKSLIFLAAVLIVIWRRLGRKVE